VIPSSILGRYARSLAEVVFDAKLEREVSADLSMYAEIFQAVPDVLEFFHTPAAPREAKEKLLDELMAHYPVNPITSNFLRILLQHNRIRFFQEIYAGYLKSVNARKGIVSASVKAVAPLSAPELKSLSEKLSAMTGKLVNVEFQADPSLLGGVVVQIGSTIYDGSIQTQLAEMRRRLAER
jgi:F-type H+-transporting ATPase subunit delta